MEKCNEYTNISYSSEFCFILGQWPSNWEYSPMIIDNIKYNCVEQYMMAEKARLFNDKETLAKIMEAPT
jgi:predicted NAD-dependent protein-ADP-ribosyltransferase YbiA (DUF1768 family)